MRTWKKITLIALPFSILMVLSLLLSGCGEKKTVEVPGVGEVTTEEGGESGKVKTEEGEFSWQEGEITEEQLGVPIYPGAEYVEGSGGTWQGSSQEGTTTVGGAEFVTDDSFDKVVSFYKSKLPGATFYSSEEAAGKQAIFTSTMEQAVITVSIEENQPENGKVKISIGKMTGSNI